MATVAVLPEVEDVEVHISDNDLQIDSTYISRHHAQVVCSRDGMYIEDLNRTNGIFFAGRRIRRRRLEDGTSVRLGLHEVTFHEIERDLVSTGSFDPADAEAAMEPAADDEEDESAVEAEEERDA